MRRLPSALVVAGALAVAACGSSGGDTDVAADTTTTTATTTAGAPPAAPGSEPDAPAGADVAVPSELDFVAPDVRGGQVVGADYAGQDLVLWFWAPW